MALTYLKAAINMAPNDSDLYWCQARNYFKLGEIDNARGSLKKAIELDPSRTELISFLAYYSASDPESEKEDALFIRRFVNINKEARSVLEKIRNKKKYAYRLEGWIASDIKIMVQKAQKAGAKVLLQNYPYRKYNGALETNKILRQVAQTDSIPFVDNELIFQKMQFQKDDLKKYFGFDKNHCNEKGYKVIAENLYGFIIDNKLIN
jgi:tetratricopeptide (TPR) repeat protein